MLVDLRGWRLCGFTRAADYGCAANVPGAGVAGCRTGNLVLQRGGSDTTAGVICSPLTPSGIVVSPDPLMGKTRCSLAGAASVLAVDASRACAACGTDSVDGSRCMAGHAPIHATYDVTQIKQAVAAAAGGGRSGKILIVPRG